MVLRPTLEKKAEKERVRVALMRAALRLASAHGFASLGLREVSREARIAPTSFYRHFADMEELGMALIRELAGRVMRGLGERARAASSDRAASVLVEAALAAVARDPELLRFMTSELVGPFGGFRSLLRAELAGLAHALHAAVTGAALDAAAPPPVAAEAAVVLLFDGCAKALDGAPERHAPSRDHLIWAIQQLMAAGAP
jgi:AcrR family transcriptional regulator